MSRKVIHILRSHQFFQGVAVEGDLIRVDKAIPANAKVENAQLNNPISRTHALAMVIEEWNAILVDGDRHLYLHHHQIGRNVQTTVSTCYI